LFIRYQFEIMDVNLISEDTYIFLQVIVSHKLFLVLLSGNKMPQ